jgi:subtilisin family serine protease
LDARSTLVRGVAAPLGAIAILTVAWLPRVPAAGRPVRSLPATTVVEVKVDDAAAVRVDGDQVVSRSGHDLSELDAVLAEPAVVDAAPLLGDLADLADLQFHQAPSVNPDAGNPASWIRVEVRGDAAPVVDRLRATPGVEDAHVAPPPPPPPSTPSFVDRETQFAPTPDGLGLTRAAVLKNATGKGVRIADIEYSWNTDHEDLGRVRTTGVMVKVGTPSDPFDDDNHGTAVAGILSADDNAFGVVGESFDSRLYLTNAGSVQHGTSVAAAITAARKKLRPGDVILIEQQVWGNGDDLVPVEWLGPNYDAIASATAAGFIVVEAAANGGVNLDAAPYGSPFPARKADSGAIMVGAGSRCYGPSSRQRLYFSDYGSRVDVQGPGECVTTTGYGDLYRADANATYTATFNGTSSASAVIAGASAALSAGYEAAVGAPPTPAQVRSLLIAHSTPQASGAAGHIGPLPDVYAALTSIDHVAPAIPGNVRGSLRSKVPTI